MNQRSGPGSVLLATLALGAAGAMALAAPTAQEVPIYSADACILASLTATPTADPAATASAPGVAEVAAAPEWLTTPLTDACSGQTFDLAQFAGKTVFVHPMATW